MTSRDRVIAAIEGRSTDRIPVAPMFWGYEYSWRLVDRPIWETIHGPAEVFLDRLIALDRRHGCDWLMVMFPGTGRLDGKRLIREEPDQCIFVDEKSGDEWIFDKRSHHFKRNGYTPPKAVPSVPSSRSEAKRLLESQGTYHSFPIIASSAGVRDLFPDRFLCGAVLGPFSELSGYIGFKGRAQLIEENPSLYTWMAEEILGDIEALSAGYAGDGLDAAILVDWWEPANPEFYKDWIAPVHRRIATAIANAGLKSVFYLHRGDTWGKLDVALNIIADLGFDAFAFEESGDGIDMSLAQARSALGPSTCIIGNLDPQFLLSGDLDALRAETLRQLQDAETPFMFGTGSTVLDNTDPSVLDYWLHMTHDLNTSCSSNASSQ